MPLFFILFAVVLAVPALAPSVDLWASGLFYRAGQVFFLANYPLFAALHGLAYDGARALGAAFAGLALAAALRHKPVLALDAKAWLFLLATLLIGPGLIANAGLKDHWGRARPREITEFGGSSPFTPALEPHFERARGTGSFVAGDAAFGFFLPALALVAPPRWSRRIFWSCMAVGAAFGFARLAMGAHFLSDILYAAASMLATISAVHAVMYGRQQTAARWRSFFSRSSG